MNTAYLIATLAALAAVLLVLTGSRLRNDRHQNVYATETGLWLLAAAALLGLAALAAAFAGLDIQYYR